MFYVACVLLAIIVLFLIWLGPWLQYWEPAVGIGGVIFALVRNRNLKDEVKALKAELATPQDHLRMRIERLHADLDNERATNSTLREDIRRAESNINRLERRLQESRTR